MLRLDDLRILAALFYITATALTRPCPDGSEFETKRKYCIWVGIEKSTYFLADAECRASGGYLLIVDNYMLNYLRFNSSLQSKFNSTESFAWIDGIDFNNPGNFYDRHNGQVQLEWALGQPDLTISNKHCLKADFTNNYLYYNDYCDAKFQPICYIDIAANALCPNDSETTTLYTNGSSLCFWVDQTISTFDVGIVNCKTNGDLVSNLAKIESASVNTFLLHKMAQYVRTDLTWWIGFEDKKTEGVYNWTDGSPVVYFNWAGSFMFSTRDCGTVVLLNFMWAEAACSTVSKSLCFKDISNITLAPISPRSAPQSVTTEGSTMVLTTNMSIPAYTVSTTQSTVFVTTTTTTTSNGFTTIQSNAVATTTKAVILTDTVPTTTSTTVKLTVTVPTTTSTTVKLTDTVPATSSGPLTTIIKQTSAANVPSSTDMCSCPCNSIGTIITAEQLALKLKELESALLMDKTTTTSYKRTKISAHDDRVSSKSIGFVGVAVLILVFGSIMSMDVPTIFYQFRHCNALKKPDETDETVRE